MQLAPDSSFSYNALAVAYLGLNRLAESKAIRKEEAAQKIDSAVDHGNLYMFAFLDGDAAGMQREVEWAKGNQGEYVMAETVADVAASSGKMAAARASYQRAVDLERQGKLEEIAAVTLAREAAFEAEMGDSKAARDDATKALSFSRGRGALRVCGTGAGAGRRGARCGNDCPGTCSAKPNRYFDQRGCSYP